MSGDGAGQVALLIDFENLVRAVDEEDIDCEARFSVSPTNTAGCSWANAYADWRLKDVNQHQTDLYALGIDLVHVLGGRQGDIAKNAVDVKMAVDAVSCVSSLPHIDVYVIVSGDRDFIHVLKELRRHGKTVVGVSPNNAVSKDFSGLCDRFVRYEALTDAADAVAPEDMTEVRSKLADIVRGKPEGLNGSAVEEHAPPRADIDLRRERLRLQELLAVPRPHGRHRASRPGTRRRRRPARVSRRANAVAPRGFHPRRRGRPDPTGEAQQAQVRTQSGAATRRNRQLHALMTLSPKPFSLLGLHESMRERDAAGCHDRHRTP